MIMERCCETAYSINKKCYHFLVHINHCNTYIRYIFPIVQHKDFYCLHKNNSNDNLFSFPPTNS